VTHEQIINDLRIRLKQFEGWAELAKYTLQAAYNDREGWCEKYKATMACYPSSASEDCKPDCEFCAAESQANTEGKHG
jgi:biotin synthase-like enzyme